MKNIIKAINAVSEEVGNIEKSMTVGTGYNSYKGVSDKEVKHAIGKAMRKNGLAIFPIEVIPNERIERWEEGGKVRQAVFVSTQTKYRLIHESGEMMDIAGYGHGTDSQDKAAGKATTYALKYALLYLFMIPTGTIDDADATHSDQIPVPKSEPSSDIIQLFNNAPDLNALKVLWNKFGKQYPSLETIKNKRKKELTNGQAN